MLDIVWMRGAFNVQRRYNGSFSYQARQRNPKAIEDMRTLLEDVSGMREGSENAAEVDVILFQNKDLMVATIEAKIASCSASATPKLALSKLALIEINISPGTLVGKAIDQFRDQGLKIQGTGDTNSRKRLTNRMNETKASFERRTVSTSTREQRLEAIIALKNNSSTEAQQPPGDEIDNNKL
jgi:hypothetical protein